MCLTARAAIISQSPILIRSPEPGFGLCEDRRRREGLSAPVRPRPRYLNMSISKTLPFICALLLLAPATSLGGPSVPAPSSGILQEPPPPPDKRAEVKDLCQAFADHIKAKGKEDQLAVSVLDKLLKEFEDSGPKDRASIVKAVDKAFDQTRREIEEGIPNNQLNLAVAVAMGDMWPESAKALAKRIGHKKLKSDEMVRRRLILSLGRTTEESGLKTLQDLLVHRRPVLQAAAAEALGEFVKLKLKKRKEVFEDILKALDSVKADVDADATDPIARERYDTVSAPMMTSLARLSGQRVNSPEEWRRWWNKNKKADWDAGED